MMKKTKIYLFLIISFLLFVNSFIPSGQYALDKALINSAETSLTNDYIIVLKNRDESPDSTQLAEELAQTYGGTILRHYQNVFKGFAARLSPESAQALSQHPQVDFVEKSGRWETAQTIVPTVQQFPPNWGLDRIDQRDRPLNHQYSYTTTGEGVNAYIIDTGINFFHTDFSGRIFLDAEFVAHPNAATGGFDCNGHGTAVAGVLGGTNHGVAKEVNLRIIRVRSEPAGQHVVGDPTRCSPGATTNELVAALDWVHQNHQKPAVVNLSWNKIPVQSEIDSQTGRGILELAVKRLIDAGITVVNSAGNNNGDAANEYPSNLMEAIVVASVDSWDVKAADSNYGLTVDVFAPGVGIQTPDIIGNNSIQYRSGTSFAAPHAAGVVARYLQTNPLAAPSQVHNYIVSSATLNKVTGFPTYTPNRLLYVQP